MSVTHRVAYLEEGDVADVRRDGYAIYDASGARVERPVIEVKGGSDAVELGPYRHFMQKEIFEQPRAVADTLEDIAAISPSLFGPKAATLLPGVDSVLILACGTSYYSSLVAKQWIETLARIPCTVEIASEYRYRDSVPDKNALVVVVSQSGETADTLAALTHAKALGQAKTLAICNVPTSSMVRQTEMVFLTRAGVEVGVASTKAFTTQLAAQFLLALTLAKLRGRLSAADEDRSIDDLRHIPAAIRGALALEPHLIGWAQQFAKKQHALFLGRGLHYPIALEGALKLKEISYIHAEAYPAGELKHGPLALVDARDAGRRDRAQRRAARKAQVQSAGSARARRRAVCRRGPRLAPCRCRRRAPDPRCRAPRAAVTDRPRRAAATARVSHRGAARDGRRQAEESREERDGGVRRSLCAGTVTYQ